MDQHVQQRTYTNVSTQTSPSLRPLTVSACLDIPPTSASVTTSKVSAYSSECLTKPNNTHTCIAPLKPFIPCHAASLQQPGGLRVALQARTDRVVSLPETRTEKLVSGIASFDPTAPAFQFQGQPRVVSMPNSMTPRDYSATNAQSDPAGTQNVVQPSENTNDALDDACFDDSSDVSTPRTVVIHSHSSADRLRSSSPRSSSCDSVEFTLEPPIELSDSSMAFSDSFESDAPPSPPDIKPSKIVEKEGWLTWTSSPPRPIPALHGPASLPYARCPSGAEGIIVEEPYSLPQVVWGLDHEGPPRQHLQPRRNFSRMANTNYYKQPIRPSPPQHLESPRPPRNYSQVRDPRQQQRYSNGLQHSSSEESMHDRDGHYPRGSALSSRLHNQAGPRRVYPDSSPDFSTKFVPQHQAQAQAYRHNYVQPSIQPSPVHEDMDMHGINRDFVKAASAYERDVFPEQRGNTYIYDEHDEDSWISPYQCEIKKDWDTVDIYPIEDLEQLKARLQGRNQSQTRFQRKVEMPLSNDGWISGDAPLVGRYPKGNGTFERSLIGDQSGLYSSSSSQSLSSSSPSLSSGFSTASSSLESLYCEGFPNNTNHGMHMDARNVDEELSRELRRFVLEGLSSAQASNIYQASQQPIPSINSHSFFSNANANLNANPTQNPHGIPAYPPGLPIPSYMLSSAKQGGSNSQPPTVPSKRIPQSSTDAGPSSYQRSTLANPRSIPLSRLRQKAAAGTNLPTVPEEETPQRFDVKLPAPHQHHNFLGRSSTRTSLLPTDDGDVDIVMVQAQTVGDEDALVASTSAADGPGMRVKLPGTGSNAARAVKEEGQADTQVAGPKRKYINAGNRIRRPRGGRPIQGSQATARNKDGNGDRPRTVTV
ncbi:hypothetical protein M422DRAFT_777544 [Sphaerobolus stellatus SS14]|nr:hypothetical protein M422DRAFT_777544 [Sphaerobolus stellatus SS14]